MRRPVLLSIITLTAAVSAVPAHADSTKTERVPAGGSLRSSTDAAPSPANPVIATVTNRNQPQPGAPSQYDGSATVTIAMKDRPDTAPGGNPEGPSGYEYMGPNVNISTPDPANVSVVFEVEGSLQLPDFSGNGSPFSYHSIPTGRPDQTGFNYMAEPYAAVERFGDDYRLTPRNGFLGSYDLLQQAFYADAYSSHDELPDALKRGVGVFLKTNFKAAVSWKIKVSDAVAHTLKLKSTTIGAKTFARPGGGDQRVPLVQAARRALKRYKRVSVTAFSVATGPNGQVISHKRSFSLKTPESDLG